MENYAEPVSISVPGSCREILQMPTGSDPIQTSTAENAAPAFLDCDNGWGG